MAEQRDTNRDIPRLWIQHQKSAFPKTTQSYACSYCLDRQVFICRDNLWEHVQDMHLDKLPKDDKDMLKFRTQYEAEGSLKRRYKKEPSQKRPLNIPVPIKELSLRSAEDESDIMVGDIPDEHHVRRKRPAVGDGKSTGFAYPPRDSQSLPPRCLKARPASAPYGSTSDDTQRRKFDEVRRSRVANKSLWIAGQDGPLTKASFSPDNIASVHIQRSRNQASQSNPRAAQLPITSTSTSPPLVRNSSPSIPTNPNDEPPFNIVLKPETRPISQEQLVAEVKGIYAGLVMVEAKCIQVDDEQATLASADHGTQPKLNNEQWQALVALHRTLLHEHHDFFLASQHPSASPALRQLASKYAMPARMWRHGIHSFLELLRHRLPASLDHMLAFIYLAYSMMALLYETVPAFEDTWIECLGDLGRYRMAIEDDDIRDREVWTAVARHWFSKVSDKAPTTGRLYHHLAILARPNPLQQLLYYAKSLCVAVPFESARESILTLFDLVLNLDTGYRQYRLPPLDTAFVKAHGLLFTHKDLGRFDITTDEFLEILDKQVGRPTRNSMEQDHRIAIALLKRLSYGKLTTSGNHISSRLQSKGPKPTIGYPSSDYRGFREKLAPGGTIEDIAPTDFATAGQLELDLTSKTPPIQTPENFDLSNFHTSLESQTAVQEGQFHHLVDGSVSTPEVTLTAIKRTVGPGLQTVVDTSRMSLSTLNIINSLCRFLLVFDWFTAVKSLPTYDQPVSRETYATSVTNDQNISKAKDLEPIWWIFLQYCGLLATLLTILRKDSNESRTLSQDEAGEVHNETQNETGSLLLFTGASAVGTFSLGFNSALSNYGLAPFWFFSAGLSIEYIRRKLAPFERTAGATGLTIALLDAALVETVVRLSPPLEGRYADPVALRICAAPPVAVFLECCYVAYILNLGVAERLEKAASRYLDGASLFKIFQDERSRSKEVRSNSRGRQGRRGRKN